MTKIKKWIPLLCWSDDVFVSSSIFKEFWKGAFRNHEKNNGQEFQVIIAKEGKIIKKNNKNFLVLLNGEIYRTSNQKDFSFHHMPPPYIRLKIFWIYRRAKYFYLFTIINRLGYIHHSKNLCISFAFGFVFCSKIL